VTAEEAYFADSVKVQQQHVVHHAAHGGARSTSASRPATRSAPSASRPERWGSVTITNTNLQVAAGALRHLHQHGDRWPGGPEGAPL